MRERKRGGGRGADEVGFIEDYWVIWKRDSGITGDGLGLEFMKRLRRLQLEWEPCGGG